ncbi:helix-turn-helix domain-containing protein [Flavobacterium sp. RHBU_3]|uniref:helix-turn-helix domain-containing protein n=1 Tax=Flavobacterium sp. RHBU_3 TaxID=3391184 RepID=UPI0039849400
METAVTKTYKIPEKILSRKDEITAGFLKLVDTHIADLMSGKATRRLHAQDFGAKLFIHPRHLTNTLKLTMNSSVCEVMEERILAESVTLIKETTLSIAEIGQKFGYDEPTNFTKFFKSMTGITPLQYRKRV